MTTILIADDHVTVRLGLEILLKECINHNAYRIEQASTGNEVLLQLSTREFDVLIMDIFMPEPNGLFLLEKALSLQPHLKVLVISINPENLFMPAVLRMGALGYINKNEKDAELKAALKTILAGNVYTSAKMRHVLLNQKDDASVFNQLTPRELDIIYLLLQGKGMQEISKQLSIHSSTTSTLKGRAFKKLGVTSFIELEQLAFLHSVFSRQSFQSDK